MKKLLNTLCISLVSAGMFLGAFSFVNAANLSKSARAFDFSKDSNSVTLNPGQLIEKITGSSIDAIERNYVDNELSNYALTYQKNQAPNNYEIVEYKNNLYINAESYTYKDKNNNEHTWIPISASYRGVENSFLKDGTSYKCSFDNYDGSTKNVDIKYALEVSLPKADVNTLLNAAYVEAQVGYNKLTSNLALESEYLEQLSSYNDYLNAVEQYEINKASYEQYLIEKNAWDIKNASYQSYLAAYQNYENELALYNQYLEDLAAYNAQVEAYAKYLNDLEYYNNNYEANRDLFEAYASSKEKIDYRLATMEIITTKMTSYERTIYDAVLGDSVTSVLSRKSDIVAAGVPSDAVDRAANATARLREVFKAYSEIETDAEKYEYYRLNWSYLRDNVNELARCLEKFLRTDIVFNILSTQENNRLEKYYILVAQLIYLADALNVSPVYNYEGWNTSNGSGSLVPSNSAILNSEFKIKISQKASKTYSEILEGTEFIDVSLKYGRPGPEKYDSELISLMNEPKPVEEPGEAPTPVKQPAAPKTVENPGPAPMVVENPGSRPAEVEMPAEPTYLDLTEQELLFGNAVIEGRISQRSEYTQDVKISIEDTRNVSFASSLKHLVKVYDDQGNFAFERIISKGLSIANNELPDYDYSKIYNSYSYSWRNEHDSLVNLATLETSCDLYATLVPGLLKEYTVSWNIDGNITSRIYHYGDKITMPQNVQKAETEDCYFEFIGWDKNVTTVKENITFTALFKTYHYMFIDKVVNGETTSYKFKEGEVNTNFETPTKPDNGDKYYEFASWKITVLSPYHLKYEAIFTEYNYIYVNWHIDENNHILNDKYRHDEEIKYPYSTPTKDGDADYATYVLDYWMDSNGVMVDLSSITASIDLYAHYVGTNESLYTVFFYVDGVIIYSNTYASGTYPDVPNVYKEGTDDYYYEFLGWDKPVTPVTKNESYVAQIELRYYINVTIIVNGEETTQKVKKLDDLILNIPTKPASNGYTYVFSEWVVTQIDSTHYTYEASFDVYFKLVLIVEGNVSEVSCKLGEEIVLDTPTKASNEVYYYSFAGWLDQEGKLVNLNNITSNTTLYASFNEHYVIYTVTWVLPDGEVVDEYHYGDALVPYLNPTKASTDRLYYEFSSWNSTLASTVTTNLVYVAIFTEHHFTVINTNVDGVTNTYRFKEGEAISIPNPIKDSDDYHDYEFSYWEILQVENEYTYLYIARFNVTTYCYVTWVNGNQVISVEKYIVGSGVTYKGNIPTKAEGETYYFEFAGWNVDLNTFKAYNDITISAEFNRIEKVMVNWMVNGVRYTEYYKIGETICLPNITVESYYDNQYFYEFTGWDKPVTGVATEYITFNAVFSKKALVNNNGTAETVSQDNGVLRVKSLSSSFSNVDISSLYKMEKMLPSILPLVIENGIVKISFTALQIQYFINSGITSFTFEYEVDEHYIYSFKLTLFNSNGGLVTESLNFDVTVYGEFDNEQSYLYENNILCSATFEENFVSISSFESNVSYSVKTTYNITFDYSPNYTLELSSSSAYYGDKIDLSISLADGYELEGIYITHPDGRKENVKDSFIMPRHNVKLEIQIHQIEYTIEFVVDGEIVAKFVGHYGDIVVDPGIKDPSIYEKESDDEYRYVFIGWDKEITTITGNTTYTAVFEAIPIIHSNIKQRVSILFTLLFVGGGTLILAAGAVTTLILIKRRKLK